MGGQGCGLGKKRLEGATGMSVGGETHAAQLVQPARFRWVRARPSRRQGCGGGGVRAGGMMTGWARRWSWLGGEGSAPWWWL